MLDALLENGAITAAQPAALSNDGDDPPPDDASAGATAVEVSVDDSLMVTGGDDRFSMDVGARLHVDFSRHTGESALADAADGVRLRRARIELGGRFYDTWRWAAEADFANDKVSVKDFWLSYRGFDGFNVTLGHQKQPYSLAVEMSSNDIPFVERSIDSLLILPFVDRAVGARIDASGEHWFAAGGVYGETFELNAIGDDGWGTASRFIYAPVIDQDRVVHIGLRGAYRQPGPGALVRINDETTAFSDLSIVDTGPLGTVRDVTLVGPELALALGRFSLFSEYTQLSVNRDTAGDLDFDGWHVGMAWALGGESRAASYTIDSGEFKRLKPDEARGAAGSWELTTRYASVDLTDADTAGGSERVVSFGANWYLNPSVRFLFNLSRVVRTDDSSAVRADSDGLNFLTLRAQYAF